MKRLVLALLALILPGLDPGISRADMYPDASNAKQPEAAQNLGIEPSITDFGAKCDGSTDDKDAFAAATDWMGQQNGRTVRIPAGICVTSQTVEVGNGRERSTTLSTAAALGATSLQVATATGIQNGDGIVVQLNSGQYRGTVNGAPAGNTVQITPALTGAAAANLRLYTAAASSTYHGAGYVGAGSCSNVAGAAISTIKYSGPAAPTTTLSAPAIAGALSIQVASIAGFGGNGLGVPIGITLDSGAVWWSWTSETPAGNTIQMMDEMPSPAAAGNLVFIANTAVIRVNGPIMGPIVEGLCLDADGKAAIGMDARQIMSGKFRGTRGITAKNYSGIGFWLHTDRSSASSSGGYSDTDHELFSETPTSDHSIGTWMAAGTDHQENNYTRLGFSRNRTHGGNFRMGGASVYAAGLRIQHIDNNTFDKPYAFTGSSPGLGAGLYRQPSWQRAGFPQENYFISPVFPNGVINGTALAAGAYIGVDYMSGYSTSDGAPLPKYAIAGTSNRGDVFGMLRPTMEFSTQFSLPANLQRSFTIAGRYGYLVEGANAGSTTLDVIDLANPEKPSLISQTTIGPGNPIGRAAMGSGYLYIPVSDVANSIYVVDITKANAPVLAATIATANNGVSAVALSGNLLVATTRTGGSFRTYDVSNPAAPKQLSTTILPNVTRATSIALRGRFAYLAQFGTTGKGLEVIDLSNPAAPVSAGSYNAGADVYGMAVVGRHAYLAKAGNILDVVNIADPAAMTSVATLAMKSISTGFAGNLPTLGNYLFWPGGTAATSTQMVDITDPAAPKALDVFGGVASSTIDYAVIGTSLIAVGSGSTDNFRVHRLYSHSLPAGQFGAMTTDQLRVRDNGTAVFDTEITANRGITVGQHGLASKGPLSGSGLTLTTAAGIQEIQKSLGISFGLGAYGAVGDGVVDDSDAVQAALDAAGAAGSGVVTGDPGKIYLITGERYIGSNTTLDCQGATITFDTGSSGNNRMFRVGYAATDLGASNVEFRNCIFVSPRSGTSTGIAFYPNSTNVRIRNNTFRDTNTHQFTAVSIRSKNVSRIFVDGNVMEDLYKGVYVDGDEMQTWINNYTLPLGSTTFTIPTESATLIAAGTHGFGVVLEHVDGNMRWYGPADYRNDFTYNKASGVITFTVPVPTVDILSANVRVWDMTASPAHDLQDLQITNNIGHRFRDSAVQINCPVHSLNVREPFMDCPRHVAITGNRFSMPAQLDNHSVNPSTDPGNMFKYSQDFTNFSWGKLGTSVAGTYLSPPHIYDMTAQKLIESNTLAQHIIQQDVTVTASTQYTFSVFLKPAERYDAQLFLRGLVTGTATNGGNVRVDLDTCTAGAPAVSGAGTNVEAGAQKWGNRWCRVWITATMSTSITARPQIFIQDAAHAITYQGDGASGIYVWGAAMQSGSRPGVYFPSDDAQVPVVTAAMIAVNGISNCTISNNRLGPTLGQAIHLEDGVGDCQVSGNVMRDVGGAGVWASASHSVSITDNNILNPFNACIIMYHRPPGTVGTNNVIDTYLQNSNTTITGNRCQGYGNPSMSSAYQIGHHADYYAMRFANNTADTLPPNIPAVEWRGDADMRISTPELTEPLTVARLGVCDATRLGQRRYVSDATAPAYGSTLVGGGAVPAAAMCAPPNWVAR